MINIYNMYKIYFKFILTISLLFAGYAKCSSPHYWVHTLEDGKKKIVCISPERLKDFTRKATKEDYHNFSISRESKPLSICITELEDVTSLSINGLQLTSLPEMSPTLSSSLMELNLSNNNLEEFPEEIYNFTSLQYLYLENNNLSGLPRTIKDLSYLQKISVFRNKNPDFTYSRHMNLFGSFRIIYPDGSFSKTIYQDLLDVVADQSESQKKGYITYIRSVFLDYQLPGLEAIARKMELLFNVSKLGTEEGLALAIDRVRRDLTFFESSVIEEKEKLTRSERLVKRERNRPLKKKLKVILKEMEKNIKDSEINITQTKTEIKSLENIPHFMRSLEKAIIDLGPQCNEQISENDLNILALDYFHAQMKEEEEV